MPTKEDLSKLLNEATDRMSVRGPWLVRQMQQLSMTVEPEKLTPTVRSFLDQRKVEVVIEPIRTSLKPR